MPARRRAQSRGRSQTGCGETGARFSGLHTRVVLIAAVRDVGSEGCDCETEEVAPDWLYSRHLTPPPGPGINKISIISAEPLYRE